MKTPSLFAPNEIDRTPSRKARLRAFCDVNNIWTHNDGPNEDKEHEPWTALLRTDEYPGEPIQIIANACAELDERGLMVSGRTEIEAVRLLCDVNGIPFDL